MNSIEKAFRILKTQGRCALIPYLMAFYPDGPTFRNLLLAAQDAGADMIEVGIPFSDPIADGPTIQEAGQRALAGGASLGKALELLAGMRKQISVPLVIMSYANLLLQYGLDRFFSKAPRAGVGGVVIPDLILEESAPFREMADKHGIELIQFIAPTTAPGRLKDTANAARGFIYLISVTGVTGARPTEDFSLKRHIDSIKKVTDVPVCVGFGIATPAQAASVAQISDGVIIGSALIEIVKRSRVNAAKALARFLRSVRKAIDAQGERT